MPEPDDTLTQDTYVSYADEIDVKEGRKKKSGETDSDKAGSGAAGGGDEGGAAGVSPATDPAAEEAAKESWLEKLKLIFIAPFSHIIPGTVSYTAENDLSKKAFFLRVGLYNRQIEPTDIADPDLIQKLEDRHQERRYKYGLGSSLSLEYLRFRPKAPGAAAPGLAAGATTAGETGGGGGTKIAVSATSPTEAVREKSIFRKTTVEERELIAQGATLEEARAEIDEYTTPEEYELERREEQAFGVVPVIPAEMELHQAFNVLASRREEAIQSVALERQLRLVRTNQDDRQSSGVAGPYMPIPEQR